MGGHQGFSAIRFVDEFLMTVLEGADIRNAVANDQTTWADLAANHMNASDLRRNEYPALEP
jgi:hypothetical protein